MYSILVRGVRVGGSLHLAKLCIVREVEELCEEYYYGVAVVLDFVDAATDFK